MESPQACATRVEAYRAARVPNRSGPARCGAAKGRGLLLGDQEGLPDVLARDVVARTDRRDHHDDDERRVVPRHGDDHTGTGAGGAAIDPVLARAGVQVIVVTIRRAFAATRR